MLNVDILEEIFKINISSLLFLALFVWLIFYILPQKIFPQEHIDNLSDRIMFNILYMLSYVLLVVPILSQIGIYSSALFFISLIFTKLLFINYYYKQNLSIYIKNKKIDTYSKILDLVEFHDNIFDNIKENIENKLNDFFKNLTVFQFLQYFIFSIVFIYSSYLFSIRGLYTLSDALPDVAQFIEWVASMERGNFWADSKTFGSDMYGQASLVFFFKSITNINSLVLFNIYPFFTVLFLLFGIYYVVLKITTSHYAGMFSVLFFSMVLMTPLAYLFTGNLVDVNIPEIVNFFNLSIYKIPDTLAPFPENKEITLGLFWRHSSGLAYELASMLFLPYIYFLIKTLQTDQNSYLVLYAITLFLAFTFHGGSVVFLIPISIMIFFNSIIYRKLSLALLKKGLLAILVSAFLGNIWMFSMIKYGLPQDVGAAMPILDKLLSTKQHTEDIIDKETTFTLVLHTDIQLIFIFISIVFLLYSFFSKDKFFLNSFAYVSIVTLVLFFSNNLGIPSLVFFQRAITYLFLSFSILSGIVFYITVINSLQFFMKQSFEKRMRYIFTVLTLLFIFITPKWHHTEDFWKKITDIEYPESPYIIYKIEKEYQPLTWTIVSDNQGFAKILGKGFHIDISNFIFNYNSNDTELQIPTETIFIVKEHLTHGYQGTGDWWLKWKNQLSQNLIKWIVTYNATHDNIITWYNGADIIVYKIDNSKYIEKLNEIAKNKKKVQND